MPHTVGQDQFVRVHDEEPQPTTRDRGRRSYVQRDALSRIAAILLHDKMRAGLLRYVRETPCGDVSVDGLHSAPDGLAVALLPFPSRFSPISKHGIRERGWQLRYWLACGHARR